MSALFVAQIRQRFPLILGRTAPVAPPISGVARQVAAGLPQQSGDGREPLGELSGLLRRRRKAPAPELDGSVGERTFTSRLIALLGDHADVEGRIPFPGA